MGSPFIFNGRRAKNLTSDGLLLSDGSKIDSDGLINYIKNGHAEAATTGWATYADAASSRPVDGTGGSANITWTRSTTTPLRGVASFLLTKDAVNRQGQGVSYDFSIDTADKAKVLNISMDWSVDSGTFSGGTSSTDSDLIVYIYDVTNATLIEPAPIKLDGAVIGTNYKYVSSFQTSSNSTSYRLIVHCATASASAYTIKFDSVMVTPSAVTTGAYVGDWQAYTPTVVGLGTISGVLMFWRRVGDSMQIRGRFNFSAADATGLTVSIPNGHSVSSPKLGSGYTWVGHWGNTNPTVAPGPVLALENETVLKFGSGSSGNNSINPVAGNSLFTNAASGTFTLEATVPITGWGTSQVLSSETDTRVVAARYMLSATTTFNATIVKYDTKDFDTHNAYNTTTGVYTVPVAGKYVVHAQGHSTTTAIGVLVRKNSTTKSRTYQISTANDDQAQGFAVLDCNAGDTIDIYSDGNYSFYGATVDNYVEIFRLSGPSQIAASESVSCVYQAAGGQSIASATFTTVSFANKEDDSHTAFSSGTTFTAPRAGRFHIEALVGMDTGTGTTGTKRVMIYKNGASVANKAEARAYLNSTNDGFFIGKTLNLVAGDKITIVAWQNIETSETLNANSYISITSR